jgi:ATP-dependent helicase YprA (DUF1998 family)
MPDLVQQLRERLEKRAKELRPMVAELEQIEQALASFPKSSAARSRVNGRAPATKRPRKRRAQRVHRSQQVLQVVKANPGITVAGIAKELGVNSTSLYPVSRKLVGEGKLKKSGTKYSVKR